MHPQGAFFGALFCVRARVSFSVRAFALVLFGRRHARQRRDFERDGLYGYGVFPHEGVVRIFRIDALQAAHVRGGLQRVSLAGGNMAADRLDERRIEDDIALRTEQLQRAVDEVEVETGVGEAFFRRAVFRLQRMQGERCIPPALLEDAINLVEQEEQAVLLTERELHLSRAERLRGDDIEPGELQDEEQAIGVCLKQAALALCLDRQREFLPDDEIEIIGHSGMTPLLLVYAVVCPYSSIFRVDCVILVGRRVIKMSLNDTPRATRLHIGLYGRRNSGKSSLLNALTGQSVATVSEVAGTTTDPVYKAMELHGIGPVVFIDTAGFDDVGQLGTLRVGKTQEAAKATDIALILFHDEDMEEELAWLARFRETDTPVVAVVSQIDTLADKGAALVQQVEEKTGLRPVVVSAVDGTGVEALRAEIIRQLPEGYASGSITGDLCAAGDLVLLVMPQDIQAPQGRLILPQVQTLRELLDKKCLVMSCTTDCLETTLAKLTEPPKLIITDSQAFRTVHAQKPEKSLLTSFSVLFAGYKGDIDYFAASARKIADLPKDAHILIAEACTHKPLKEDIGRVKIPRLLRKKLGGDLRIDVVAGRDFPADLSGVDLVIHCGGCMFNRKYVLSRVAECREQGVPMTNYGITIAYLLGILDDVTLPSGN